MANDFADSVVRIDPETNTVQATIPVGRRPTGIAVGSDAVWVANAGDGTLSRIDPETNEVAKTIRVGSSPSGVTAAAGSIWVTVQDSAPPAPANGAESSGGSAHFNIASGFDFTDPALAYFLASWQLEYATCAKLLNYPDRSGPAGSRLVPEVARSLPTVSAGGRRYVQNPRGLQVLAAVERARHRGDVQVRDRAQHEPEAEASRDCSGLYGRPCRPGRIELVAEHISGVVARGTGWRSLTRAAPDFPARIALPFFCAVPIGTPIDPGGLREIPSAGPYYVSSYTPNEQIVLRRNPNYQGPRPTGSTRSSTRSASPRTVAQIEAGEADYAPDGVPPRSRAARGYYWRGRPGGRAGDSATSPGRSWAPPSSL